MGVKPLASLASEWMNERMSDGGIWHRCVHWSTWWWVSECANKSMQAHTVCALLEVFEQRGLLQPLHILRLHTQRELHRLCIHWLTQTSKKTKQSICFACVLMRWLHKKRKQTKKHVRSCLFTCACAYLCMLLHQRLCVCERVSRYVRKYLNIETHQ